MKAAVMGGLGNCRMLPQRRGGGEMWHGGAWRE